MMAKRAFIVLIIITLVALTGCESESSEAFIVRLSDRLVPTDNVPEPSGPTEESTIPWSTEDPESEEATDEATLPETEVSTEEQTDPPVPDTTTPTQPPIQTVTTPQVPSTEQTTVPQATHAPEDAVEIGINTLPAKTSYDRFDEVISLAGLSLRVFFNDGSEEVVDTGYTAFVKNGFRGVSFNRIVTYDEGEYPIYIQYGNCITSFIASYHDAEDSPLWWEPANHSDGRFYEGTYSRDTFKVIRVGKTVIDMDELSFSPEILTEAGTVTITVRYGLHMLTRQVTVIPKYDDSGSGN